VKVLAGKTAGRAPASPVSNESVNGGSGSADIESMLQLVHLNLTAPRKDATIQSLLWLGSANWHATIWRGRKPCWKMP
jgi:hypothetical protein